MQSFSRRFALAFVLAGLCHTTASAQEGTNLPAASGIAPGDRISFTVPDVQSPEEWKSRRLLLKGTVTELRGDSLVVQVGGAAPVTLSRLAIGDLSVSRGMQRGWRSKPGSTAFAAALLIGNAFMFHRYATGPAADINGRSSAYPLAGLLAINVGVVFRQAFAKKERWERVEPR
jgi:hypothetical protein